MTSNVILSLVVMPEIGDAVTDWLLEQERVSGFSSSSVSGHGSSLHSMSLAEQVAGKQYRVMFQLHLPADFANSLLESIKRDFRGSGIHYWLVPVLEYGHLD